MPGDVRGAHWSRFGHLQSSASPSFYHFTRFFFFFTLFVPSAFISQLISHFMWYAVLLDQVVIASNAVIAGHVRIDAEAIVGGQAGIKQFVHIGRGTMIGGLSAVSGNVIPYGLVKGNRAQLVVSHHRQPLPSPSPSAYLYCVILVKTDQMRKGLNLVGLRRKKVPNSEIRGMLCCFHYLFPSSSFSSLPLPPSFFSALQLPTGTSTLVERATALQQYLLSSSISSNPNNPTDSATDNDTWFSSNSSSNSLRDNKEEHCKERVLEILHFILSSSRSLSPFSSSSSSTSGLLFPT